MLDAAIGRRPRLDTRERRGHASPVRALALVVLVAACTAAVPGSSLPAGRPPAQALHVEVVERIPHDPQAFTQGLVLVGGRLYESTGGYGASTLRELDPRTGAVRRSRRLPPRLFGEGLAAVGPRLVQLTWREGRALVWQASTLREQRSLRYRGEGWGLCFDGRRLVQSDGSSRLVFRDPDTFARRGSVAVTLAGDAGATLGVAPGPVSRLNELECLRGKVYANVWQTDAIVRVDPRSGRVEAVIDASALPRPTANPFEDVLNGIAYEARRGTFLLTGKRWPWLYRVRVVAR